MTLSPIAFELGPLVIRWYALAYVVGILLAQRYIRWLDRRRAAPLLNEKAYDDLILYGVLGVILGGRLGYVLFYNTLYYLHNPLEILYVWQGGMAFHGGLIGVMVAFALFARRHKLEWLRIIDIIAAASPIGLLLGRLANFVNGELYGRVTDLPWGVVFKSGGPLPRHPSQLYEAALEGLVLGLLLWWLAAHTNALNRKGILAGVFAVGYGLSRFLVECVREPDTQLGFLALGLTMGQWLSLPLMAVGTAVLLRARRFR